MKRIGILDKLYDKYADESFEVQKKIKIVFWANLIMGIITGLLYILAVLGIKLVNELNMILVIAVSNIVSLIFLFQKKYYISSLLTVCGFQLATLITSIFAVGTTSLLNSFTAFSMFMVFTLIISNVVPTNIISLIIVSFGPILYFGIFTFTTLGAKTFEQSGGLEAFLAAVSMVLISGLIFFLSGLNNRSIISKINKQNLDLHDIIEKLKSTINELVAISKEMHATVEEQNSAATQQASGITEVSATLEELSITANQITVNAGDLVVASEETVHHLSSGQSELDKAVNQLDDVSRISKNNSSKIGQLGKRSKLINQMVEIIKDIANKTNMLSVNASIEASRAGESGKGFSVVAAEIRELSKETIITAKKVEETAFEIQTFINDIIISSESESEKVLQSAEVAKKLFQTITHVVEMINKNYSFTQKIDVSITQQENGSKQAAETMRQLAEVAKQSAEVAKQTSEAVQNIVDLSNELENLVQKYKN